MSEFVLQIDGLRKTFGALVATDNVTLNISAGETHALIGPNGAGKTTLVGQLTGEITPDAGTIRFGGRDITSLSTAGRARLGLARSFQITSIFPTFTSEENVALAVQATEPHSFRFWRPAAQIARLREPARNLLADVGLAPAASRVAAAMSHGQHRQLELAWHWRRGRPCCCSTNRWPASASRNRARCRSCWRASKAATRSS